MSVEMIEIEGEGRGEIMRGDFGGDGKKAVVDHVEMCFTVKASLIRLTAEPARDEVEAGGESIERFFATGMNTCGRDGSESAGEVTDVDAKLTVGVNVDLDVDVDVDATEFDPSCRIWMELIVEA